MLGRKRKRKQEKEAGDRDFQGKEAKISGGGENEISSLQGPVGPLLSIYLILNIAPS